MQGSTTDGLGTTGLLESMLRLYAVAVPVYLVGWFVIGARCGIDLTPLPVIAAWLVVNVVYVRRVWAWSSPQRVSRIGHLIVWSLFPIGFHLALWFSVWLILRWFAE